MINRVSSQMWMSPLRCTFCVCCSAEPNSALYVKQIGFNFGGILAFAICYRLDEKIDVSLISVGSEEKWRTGCKLRSSSKSKIFFIIIHYFLLAIKLVNSGFS